MKGDAVFDAMRAHRCAVLATLGLSINLLWCTLAGHAVGFSALPHDLGLAVNPRLFFLLGIFIVGVAFVAAPRLLREHDRPLAFILPLASSVGTACFALAAKQSLFEPALLSVVGLVVFGVGYFWIVARYNLLLARTQSFRCAAWCIAAALALETLTLPLFESLIPPVWQVSIAIALPIVSSLLYVGAYRSALSHPSLESENTKNSTEANLEPDAAGLPKLPRRTILFPEQSGKRRLMVLIVAASILLATVRSFSSIGLWGENPSSAVNALFDFGYWAVSALLLALFAYLALVRTTGWPLKSRFQPAFIIVIGGLFLVVSQQSTTGSSSALVNELMRLDDSYAHLLFWIVVITAVDALSTPSYRIMGVAAISYAASSILWVLLLSTGTAINGVIALVAVYGLTVIAMHSEWIGSEATRMPSEASQSETPSHNKVPQHSLSTAAKQQEPLSGRQVSQIITSRCEDLAASRKLSPRETEIFILLAQGRTRTLIQEELVLAENTVKTHISHIYAKLNVGNRQDMMSLVLDASKETERNRF